MRKAFKNITNSIIGISILALVIGIIFILFPTVSLKTLGIVSAVFLIIHGIVLLSLEMRLTKIFVPFESMLSGVLSIILGIVLFAKPESASILVTIAIGTWIIVSSVNNIKVACFFRKIKSFPSTEMIILGILDIILGLLVILNPFEASITLTLYLGAMIIVHSVYNIINMVLLKKNVKDKENYIKEKFSLLFQKKD